MEFQFFPDMRNIKLIISYDGTFYAGWQRQKEILTVQQVLEESIGVMTREKNEVHGAGRTDAGVHALAMAANFHTESAIPCHRFPKGLNRILPEDIRILSALDAPDDFHARFSATGKLYQYNFIISPIQLPTERLYNTHIYRDAIFNTEAVSDCLEIITGKHDFSSFEKVGSRDRTITGGLGAVREIFSAKLLARERSGYYAIEISGSGFLRYMVRNIVGTLFDVGFGRKTVPRFREILQGKDRALAGPTAPAKGLFLKEVYY